MQKKPKAKSKNHEIIGHFLNADKAKADKYFWPREMKIAGKLLKLYPLEFLRTCKQPLYGENRLPSLAWFLTEDGKQFLAAQYFEYQKSKVNLVEKREEIILQDEKIGEDVQVVLKPRTLKDFLKMYGKN